jgi:hypothetical protein
MTRQALRSRTPTRDAASPAAARSPFDFLARHNVLYILSALLMLVGCLLISLPRPFSLPDLVVLLVVINLYEAMVIAAIAWVTKRAPASRETNVLLVIATAFLLDAHFTVNACVTADPLWGALIAAAALALAFAKVYLLARLSGGRVFDGAKRVLLPAIAFAHAFQAVLVLARNAPAATREVTTFALWLALGAAPLLFMMLRPGNHEGDPDDGMPGWRTHGFARAVGALVVIVPLALLAGQTWAHDAPFSVAMLLPLVFALLAAARAIFPRAHAESLRAVRVVLTALAVVVAMATEEFAWGTAPGLVLSPMRVGLVFGAAAFLIATVRERGRATWDLAFALLAVATLGHDGQRVMKSLAEPGGWQAAAMSMLAFVWWLRGRSPERAVAAAGVGIVFFAGAAGGGAWRSVIASVEFLRWMPAACLAIVSAYGVRERMLRPVLFATVFALGAGGLIGTGAGPVVYFFGAGAALGAATLRGGRTYAIGLAAYPVASAMVWWRMPLPDTPGEWGAVVIVCAFGAMAGALAVTRARMGHEGAGLLRDGGDEGGGS